MSKLRLYQYQNFKPSDETESQILLKSKQDAITGSAVTIDTENLTANHALVTDNSGNVVLYFRV